MFFTFEKILIKLLFSLKLLRNASAATDGYIQRQIPTSYLTPLNANFARTIGDCAFECSHLAKECGAFALENDLCWLAKVIVPPGNSSFVPNYLSDTVFKTVLIKKKHIELGAKKAVTHLGYLDLPDISGKKYDLVMDDQTLMKVTVTHEFGPPYFAVMAYKNGLLACGGFGNKQCR